MTLLATSGRRADSRRLLAAFAVFGVYWGAWGALLPDVKANLGATEAELGQALLFIPVGSIAAMLSAGRLVDRVGRRAFAPSLLVYALVAPLPGLASSMPAFIASLVLLGLASGLLDVVINACVSAYEIGTERRLMGAAHAAFSAGVLPAGIAVGAARTAGGTPGQVLTVVALLTAVTALIGMRLNVEVGRSEPGVPAPLGKPMGLLGVLCALAFLIEDGMLSWSAIHLEETLGASAFVGSLGPASLAAAMVAGRALTQTLSRHVSDRVVVTWSGVLGALGAALVALAPHPAACLFGVIVTGGAISACAPLIFGLAGRMGGPGQGGRAIARVTTIAYTGFFVGPPLVGGVAGVAGLRAGMAAMGVVAVALAFGARRLPSSSGRA
ncbi:MAG: MFS transporter [Actinomycetota bacterium]